MSQTSRPITAALKGVTPFACFVAAAFLFGASATWAQTSVTNTATVSYPNDLTPDNNSASDTDTVTSRKLTLTKVWSNTIAGNAVSLTISAGAGDINAAVAGSSTAPSTTSNATADAKVGATITLTEAFTVGSAANYTTTLACTKVTGGASVAVTDSDLSGTIVMPGDSDVTCTFTNTRKTATLTLQKTWVNAIVGDDVSIDATGLLGLGSIADSPNETDPSSARTVRAGDVLTLSETFNTGSAANYTTTLACTGTSGLSGSTLTVGSADTAIVCTYTNTRKTATLTLQKTWVNAIVGDDVSIDATGLLGLGSIADSPNETDPSSARTVRAGDVLTLSETFNTGSAANYTTTLACTGTSGLSGSTLTVGSADTAIVCTYTNTRKTATVTLQKIWVGAELNHAVIVSATGLTSLNAVANTASETDAGSAQTVRAGDVLTLSETFNTGSAANYTTTLACTGTSGLSGSTLTVGSADTAIVCTYTNTRKTATVTLQKIWVGAELNHAVIVSATGLTSLNAVANTASETDAGSAQTVRAGDVLTLSETFTIGSAANYTTTLACTGTSGLSGSTLTVGSADTAIVCTYTNTFNPDPSLTVDKTAGTPTGNTAGNTIAYSFLVTNTGNVTLTGIVINDAQLSAAASCPVTTLAPGASTTCTGTHTITQAEVNAGVVNNSATATGNPPSGGPTTSPPDTTSTPLTQSPSLTIDKTAGTPSGSLLPYTFLVTNTGNVTLTGIVINDAQLSAAASCPVTTLAPGASTTCTGTHTITQAEVNAGVVNNSATATGNPPSGGPTTSPPDTTSTPLTQSPSLTIDKTAGTPSGSLLPYTFLVTNTGNVTLTGIVINDAQLSAAASCPVTTLAPGASTTCTGSHMITQAEVNAGVVNNSATATGNPPSGGPTTSPPDTTSTPLTQSPSQTVVKVLTNDSTGGSVALGDVLTYTVTMTNTGNTTLTGVVVSDALITPNSITCASVLPGTTCVLTGTYTVTQADVNAGSISNTGTVTSPLCPAGGAGVCTTTIVTPVPQTAALTIDKTAGTPTGNTAGNTIAYSFLVTNTGNVTLTGIVINDAQLSAAASCPVTTLAPGASTTCTGTHTITQAEVNAGVVNNSATATGNPPSGGPTTSPPDTTSTPLTQSPSLTIDKTAGTPSGSLLPYTFLVTNTGNVTLTGIVINDAQLNAAASCPVTTLAPGASTTCTGTHMITQADVDAGVVNNTATATGTPPGGGTITSPPDSTSTPVSGFAELSIDKASTTTALTVTGQVVPYTYLVTNTGTITINSLSVTDDKIALVSCPVSTLAPTASTTCSGSYTVTQADLDAGGVTNIATTNGTPVSGTLAPVTDTVTINATATPTLTIDKTAGTPTGNTAGSTIAYSFLVTNTGNVTLTGIVINDAQLSAAASCPVTTLAPGASTTCTGTHTITQAEVNAGVVNNSATATGNPPSGGPTTSPPDTTSTPLTQSPSLTIDKTAGTPSGSLLPYTFLVTNTGNVTLTGIVINDAQLSAAASCPVTTLAPGASTTCTGSHMITQAEVNAGVVNNSATATGNPPSGGPTTSPPDTTSTPLTQSPSQTVVKVLTNDSTGGSVALGDVLTYTVTMTNTGNTTLTGVVVSDALITPNSITCASVLPGTTCVLTGTYTVTQADVNAGSISNTGTVTSPLCPAGGAGVCTTTIVTPVPQTAALTIDKTAGTPTGNTAGSTIAYSFLVTNTGNVTLTGIVINDAQLSAAASCPVTTLAPGASTTCTGSHMITQAEVNAGVVNNSATATGNPPSGGPTTSPPDTTSTPLTQSPSLTIDKTAGTPSGSLLPYTFLVTNTGNVTLTGIVINDAQLSAAASCPVTTLAPGASTTCTGSHMITQAEVNAGVVNNSATATGNPPSGGPTTSPPDTTSTPLTQSPSQTVVKVLTNDSTGGSVALGDVLTYTVTMTNTGNTTLTGVVVSDALITPNSITCASVLPGTTCVLTGTYTVTQADVNAGSISNTGTVTSPLCPAGGAGVCTTTIVTPVPQTAALTIDKTAGTPTGNTAGSTIAYSFLVTNTGNVTLTGIVINDAQLSAAASCPVTTLAPGASTTCTGSHMITQAEVNAGVVNNSATATGNPPSGGPTTSPPDTTSTPLTQSPSLTIDKTAGTPSGSLLPYTFLVTNTGNVTLTGIVINDAQLSAAASCPVTTLAPGASTTCTGSHMITQAEVNAGVVNNSATATGNPPSGGPTTSPPDTTSTPISPNPVISVTDATALEGANLVHTASLTGPTQFPSTYPLSLTGVTATPGDDFTATTPIFSNGVTLSGGFILVPTGVSNFTISYPALIDNIIDDGETTILTIGGVSGLGTITDQSLPELRIIKQANTRQATIGGMVLYTLTITNIGNSPALNFDVIDTPPQGFSYVPGSALFQDGDNAGTASGTGPVTFSGLNIAVGQTATIRYFMRVSAGLPSGEYVNRAQAFKDGDPISNESMASVRLDKGTDPLFEQSRVWGKVWDDRNGDGWQDPDEKGIPGVRLATVEGLVAETDAKGRYHFEGLTLSNMQRGQNFIVKVDVSTLPEGSAMMTENPLLRRITPAVPVRFDFGVKLPPQITPEALPVIAPVPNEPVRLGAVFFDTDKTTIKPEYMAMLRDVAVRIEKGGTNTVLLTGFADKRASVAYNLDLARRRAQAVYAEIARQLSPEAKGRLRVELDSAEPATGAQP